MENVGKGLISMNTNSLTILLLHALLGHLVVHFLAMISVFQVTTFDFFRFLSFTFKIYKF